MRRVIITDTSCIIAFDILNKLEILRELYGRVFITDVIAKEYGKRLPDFFIIEALPERNIVDYLVKENLLDLGEATAIALAKSKDDDVLLIIDEYKGRKVAKLFGIKITGTIGVLVRAKEKGLIADVRSLLTCLEKAKFRIDKKIIEITLKECGEL